jgi:organic radical activating enzyme
LYAQEDFGEAQVAQAVALLDSAGAEAFAREEEGKYYRRATDALSDVTITGGDPAQLAGLIAALVQREY